MLGQLCRLPSDVLAKQVFVNRLTRFLLLYSQFQGFIPGIHAIAKKFCLEAYLKHYCTTNCCTKQTWKCTLKRAIYGRLATRYTREPQKQLTENDPRGRIVSRPFSSTCNRCDLTQNIDYFVLVCEDQWKQLWRTVIDKGGIDLLCELKRLWNEDQCARLLGLTTKSVNNQLCFHDITIALGRLLNN